MKACEKQTVMIVDDSLLIREQIKSILKDIDLNICEATTGREALDRMHQYQPDLILLDVVLPDIDGYTLCSRLKEADEQEAVIVFLTSMNDSEDVIRGFSVGASDYIKKPFHPEEVKSRAVAHLAIKKQKDELSRQNRELRTNMKKLNDMAFRDGLTGLYNRRYVVDDLAEEIKCHDRNDVKNVLIMADIDDFKKVNDTYGHEAGDIALVCVSNILESVCRRHRVIRWGGEEFLVVLFAVTRAEAFAISEQVRKEIAVLPVVYDDTTFYCTITLGMSAYDNRISMEENVANADKALYEGKRSGKNRSVWYDEIAKMERANELL